MLLKIETCHGCPRLFLVAQYYAALKYAAESTRLVGRNRARRRVYLMPLGGADGGWVYIGVPGKVREVGLYLRVKLGWFETTKLEVYL